MSGNKTYSTMPFDRWASATGGFVKEVASQDTVFFTSLVDATDLCGLRKRYEDVRGVRPSYTAMVVKAISLALRDNPRMNRLVLKGLFRHRPVQLHRVDAVVAVERVRGESDTVYAGVLRGTDRRSVGDITAELKDLTVREEWDDDRLRLFMRLVRWVPGFLCRWITGLPRFGPKTWVEQRGGAFALTTVGKYKVDAICAKWPWPLTFTFGEVNERPVAEDGAVTARMTFNLSMGFDRRLCNGAPAARFFHEVARRLAEADLEETVPLPVGGPTYMKAAVR